MLLDELLRITDNSESTLSKRFEGVYYSALNMNIL